MTVILSILPVRDIARCRRGCVLFQAASCDKTLWAQLLRRDFPLSEIKSGDSPEALYRSLSEWCFEPTFFSVNSTQVESASRVDQPYQVPHAKRVMTTGVHSWEIIIHNAGKTPTTNNWYFVGVGTHVSASCGSYDKRGSACLDKNAYVLGFDGHLYQAAKACGSVKEKQRPGCYGMVLDCDRHELRTFSWRASVWVICLCPQSRLWP